MNFVDNEIKAINGLEKLIPMVNDMTEYLNIWCNKDYCCFNELNTKMYSAFYRTKSSRDVEDFYNFCEATWNGFIEDLNELNVKVYYITRSCNHFYLEREFDNEALDYLRTIMRGSNKVNNLTTLWFISILFEYNEYFEDEYGNDVEELFMKLNENLEELKNNKIYNKFIRDEDYNNYLNMIIKVCEKLTIENWKEKFDEYFKNVNEAVKMYHNIKNNQVEDFRDYIIDTNGCYDELHEIERNTKKDFYTIKIDKDIYRIYVPEEMSLYDIRKKVNDTFCSSKNIESFFKSLELDGMEIEHIAVEDIFDTKDIGIENELR